MRVLVCGGRSYGELTLIRSGSSDAVMAESARLMAEHFGMLGWLSDMHRTKPITCIIEGGANGADTAARIWAGMHDVPGATYPAYWKLHGRQAGPIRNRLMLTDGEPDLVVAFPGGSGTRNMISLAKRGGVRVDEVPHDAVMAADIRRAPIKP